MVIALSHTYADPHQRWRNNNTGKVRMSVGQDQMDQEPDKEAQGWHLIKWNRNSRSGARLRAISDRHLVSMAEQPSQAALVPRGFTPNVVAWHMLPMPLIFELADAPYSALAQVSRTEENLRKSRHKFLLSRSQSCGHRLECHPEGHICGHHGVCLLR